MLKYCNKCKIKKELTEFYKCIKGQYGRRSQCKICEHDADLKRSQTDKTINKILISKYGITLKEYNKMVEQQNNKCAICKNEYKEGNKKLAVDHCHKTGKIRGLLCSNCNPALGFLKEDLNIIKNLVRYIKNKGV